MARAPTLLLTHSADVFTIDRVAAALAERGRDALRVDTDRFGSQWSIEHGAKLLLHGPRTVDLRRVPSIWLRRLWAGPEYRQIFDQLVDCRWVNPPEQEARAEAKLLQLETARSVGLITPPTLVTNAPKAVRAFHAKHGRLITKLLYPTVQSMQPDAAFVYTTELTAQHYAQLGKAPFAPQIFQPLLDKEREVRLIAVGSKLFAGAIDARSSQTGWLDWRRVQPSDRLAWQLEPVPSPLATRVKRFMRAFGLVYAAFDFIVMKKNRWVFLEVNPAGEYGWLERDLGLPISDAIAGELCRP